MTDLLTIRTEIAVAASPLHVWATLIDFPAYPEWNSYLVRVGGAAVAGPILTVHAEARPGEPPLVQPNELSLLESCYEVGGRLAGPQPVQGRSLLDGCGRPRRHHADAAVRSFFGSSGGGNPPQHDNAIFTNFERFNLALKSRVESLA